MRHILHVLTRQAEPFTAEVIQCQRELPEHQIEVLDLTQAETDYDEMLDQIFQADSVQVW